MSVSQRPLLEVAHAPQGATLTLCPPTSGLFVDWGNRPGGQSIADRLLVLRHASVWGASAADRRNARRQLDDLLRRLS